jgi:hypothetical protein
LPHHWNDHKWWPVQLHCLQLPECWLQCTWIDNNKKMSSTNIGLVQQPYTTHQVFKFIFFNLTFKSFSPKQIVHHKFQYMNIYKTSLICTLHQIFGWLSQGGWDGQGMGEMRNAYKILVWNLEGKIELERSWCRWEDNIKMDLKEQGMTVWTQFSWLRTGFSGRFLWTW